MASLANFTGSHANLQNKRKAGLVKRRSVVTLTEFIFVGIFVPTD